MVRAQSVFRNQCLPELGRQFQIRFKSSPNRAGPQSTKCHPNGPRGYIPCRFTDGFDRSEDCNVIILWSGPSAIICDDKFALDFEVKLGNT